jgi:exodeoxyribonuclease X
MLVQRLVEHAWSRTQVEAGAWEELSAFSRAPLDVQTFSFGKYRGSLVEDIAAQDPPYIKWLLAQMWLPADYPDLYHTLLRKLPGG